MLTTVEQAQKALQEKDAVHQAPIQAGEQLLAELEVGDDVSMVDFLTRVPRRTLEQDQELA